VPGWATAAWKKCGMAIMDRDEFWTIVGHAREHVDTRTGESAEQALPESTTNR
jgi:hypothetical protein